MRIPRPQDRSVEVQEKWEYVRDLSCAIDSLELGNIAYVDDYSGVFWEDFIADMVRYDRRD